MNGVDLADKLTVFYGFVRKSCKWWRKVFFGLFEVTIINSYILYKTANPRISHLQFRRALVDRLSRDYIQQSIPRPLAGRPRSSLENQPERLDSRKHFVAKRPIKQQYECIICSKPRKRRTFYHCKTCSSHPPSCPIPCFEIYHTHSSI